MPAKLDKRKVRVPDTGSFFALRRVKTVNDLLRWAAAAWGEGSGGMRSPQDIREQISRSCHVSEDSDGVAVAFIRLPEKEVTYGGYETLRVVRASVDMRSGRVVEILYEPQNISHVYRP